MLQLVKTMILLCRLLILANVCLNLILFAANRFPEAHDCTVFFFFLNKNCIVMNLTVILIIWVLVGFNYCADKLHFHPLDTTLIKCIHLATGSRIRFVPSISFPGTSFSHRLPWMKNTVCNDLQCFLNIAKVYNDYPTSVKQVKCWSSFYANFWLLVWLDK